jgi:hypothetical protein
VSVVFDEHICDNKAGPRGRAPERPELTAT